MAISIRYDIYEVILIAVKNTACFMEPFSLPRVFTEG